MVQLLTDREREVCQRVILDAETRQAVASDLGVSKRTIDMHVANIYRKMGVSSLIAAHKVASGLDHLRSEIGATRPNGQPRKND